MYLPKKSQKFWIFLFVKFVQLKPIILNSFNMIKSIQANDRAELVAELLLLKFHVSGSIGDIVKRAAEMLKADEQEMNRLEQCRIDEAETTNKAAQASRDLLTKTLQLVAPMSDEQIVDWMWGRDLNRLDEDQSEQVFLLIRDVEAHYQIGAKP